MSARQRLIVAASILAIGLALCAPAVAEGNPGARDVCREHSGYDYDPYGRWVDSLVTTLCNDGNADSKLAVYLISIPPIEGAHAKPDNALLGRALEGVRENDAPLLFIAAMRDGGECADKLAFARQLTDTDAGNGFAWLIRTSIAEACDEDADEAITSMMRAARSYRFHDYMFDIMKRVAARLATVPVPAEAIEADHAETADQVRFESIKLTFIVGMAMGESMPMLDMAMQVCSGGTSGVSDEVRVACERVKRGLSSYGDSVALLAYDPERQRAAMKDIEAAFGDQREAVVAKAAMRAMAQSHSENEFFRRTRALVGQSKAPAKAH